MVTVANGGILLLDAIGSLEMVPVIAGGATSPTMTGVASVATVVPSAIVMLACVAKP